MLTRPESPKLSAATRHQALYPYYAGFSEAFVESVLNQTELRTGDIILDPWNGSGTTTAVCARKQVQSIGLDINPAMKPIAVVRSMESKAIVAGCSHAIDFLNGEAVPDTEQSPFERCAELLSRTKKKFGTKYHDVLRVGFMIACRRLAKRARSKNPTWFSLGAMQSLRVPSNEIDAAVMKSFDGLRSWSTLSLDKANSRLAPKILTSNWNLKEINYDVTHVIGSPPYLTRIDYVMKTLPELLLLSNEKPINVERLRRAMLGSVLTEKTWRPRPSKSLSAAATLKLISEHEAKASKTYYFRFFDKYMFDLSYSIKKIADSFPNLRFVTLVTQGTYYKEIFVDLPRIVDEFMALHGYFPAQRFEFVAKNAMVTLNQRAIASKLPPPAEHAVIYERRIS